MKKIIIFALLMLAACSDSKTTMRILVEQGFTEIETTGYSFFSCSEKDSFSTGFKAKSPNGKVVNGVVCSGWLIGATVRYF